MREQEARAINARVDSGAVGPRPKPREETEAAERRYAEIAQAAKEAKATLPAVEKSLTEALQRLRAVTTKRDQAIFGACGAAGRRGPHVPELLSSREMEVGAVRPDQCV